MSDSINDSSKESVNPPRIKRKASGDHQSEPAPKKRAGKKNDETEDESLDAEEEEEELTKAGLPRQRGAPRNVVAAARPIPLTWDTADAADKRLLTMRDNGEDWGAIRLAWAEETGDHPAPSTLPNRYNRIKARMVHLHHGDTERILAAKTEVEAKFRAEKVGLIAACIEKSGGRKFSIKVLERHLKRLEKNKVLSDDDEEEEE